MATKSRSSSNKTNPNNAPLGQGLARRAANQLGGRGRQIDAIVDAAARPKPKKR